MSIYEKICFLRQERYEDLNDWSKGFIEDLYETVDLAEPPTDEEIKEFFTRRQIEKINEIWEDMGL